MEQKIRTKTIPNQMSGTVTKHSRNRLVGAFAIYKWSRFLGTMMDMDCSDRRMSPADP